MADEITKMEIDTKTAVKLDEDKVIIIERVPVTPTEKASIKSIKLEISKMDGVIKAAKEKKNALIDLLTAINESEIALTVVDIPEKEIVSNGLSVD